jgi:hypothetical protein
LIKKKNNNNNKKKNNKNGTWDSRLIIFEDNVLKLMILYHYW